MSIIKYHIGHESSTIVENDNYAQSIFSEQYRHSLSLVNDFVRTPVADNLQIIAFCGDRGEGKSSCMKTVIEILKNSGLDPKGEANRFINDNGFNHILRQKFEIPEMIDPSFFEDNCNILELILGQLYGDLVAYKNANKMTIDRVLCNSVFDSLAGIRECLLTVHGNERHKLNEFSDLSVLSNSVRLKDNIKTFVDNYLKLIGKTKLVITVDDLDLNAKGAYEMCEQIRKYLCFSSCIIFVSFKFEQLLSVISLAMSHIYNVQESSVVADREVRAMSEKYLNKLLPTAQRVHMPKAYDLCDRTLRIYDGYKVISLHNQIEKVKDVVVNLIFQKTRFLFYNNKGGISPIVPNNLRELFQLLGMLWRMPQIPPKSDPERRREVLDTNKHEFKIYFFNYWTKCLDEKYLVKVRDWAYDTNDSSLNKSVVSWIKDEFSSILSRQYDEQEDSDTDSRNKPLVQSLLKCIVSDSNFSYNVSVGDVFYLIHLLERDELSIQHQWILFFIKSLYSIRLFECYDIITESTGERYPKAVENGGIYRIDHRFDHTNDLQRLVNGAYFTFLPEDLIGADSAKKRFDTRVVKGGKEFLVDLLNKCRRCVSEYDTVVLEIKGIESMDLDDELREKLNYLKNEEQYLRKYFRLTEFFIFMISGSIIQKDVRKFYSSDCEYRSRVVPYALNSFNPQMGYYVFNIMNPFYVMINPEYAYHRFSDNMWPNSDEDVDIFKFAMSHDFSLIRSMIFATSGENPAGEGYEDRYDLWLCNLQSDSVIRNSEVLMAMFDNAVAQKNTAKNKNDIKSIASFYNNIIGSGLSTHIVGNKPDDKRYPIKFAFLSAIVDFIRRDLEDNIILQDFLKIFDPVEANELTDKTRPEIKKQKTANSVDLSMNDKAVFIERLKGCLGNKPLTASQIISKICNLYPELKNLSDKDLKLYVTKKSGDAAYSLYQLAEFILKDEYRYQEWVKVLEVNEKPVFIAPF